ncbi:hypothetical protein [Abyssisolibacter fermentans]|uniref:hypothetical protein n=1 Tax=Abyssisolibacter fermentans TaxID=1766203 RepID=UPI0008298AA2|nr:hypothetical protein [Abyssisolibacter fermentans]
MEKYILYILLGALILFSIIIIVKPTVFITFYNTVLGLFGLQTKSIDGSYKKIRILGSVLLIFYAIILKYLV